ncbi:sensor histidine kinase [Alkalimarinus alittae]|uniref:histidine kinase n=1 Tax=Alkalimarinus alittae TaxID=2961619 RepID=A0ABY6N3V1_9ALTE|nr:HAMP domain-containing sensor histidine kinase [Alkalimarinus alittae]UZE96800.1 HAMP domain-containing histidine kinase [Alkalimarinus alittae]
MTQLYMQKPVMLFRPRSLLQLVVISFVLVLTPLAALLIQAMQALEDVSMKGRLATLEIVSLAKSSQSLPGTVLDMEHSARQYQVLGDPKLKGIFQVTESRFKADLEGICKEQNAKKLQVLCKTLASSANELIATLSEAPYDSDVYGVALLDFELLTKHTQQLVQETQQLIQQQSEQLATDAASVKSTLLWQGVSLVPLSIAMSILFTFLIIRPIQRLEEIIQQLGSGQEPKKFDVYGPRELNNLGEKLQWLQSRLQALEEQKLRFIRQMSHELKTPLASLREGADLMEEEILGPLTDSQREIVMILQDKGLQLQRIIENLLDFNGLKHQRSILVSQFDLRKLVDEVLREHRLDIQRADLHYCLDGHELMVSADKVKLRTLLGNLISNATYYSLPPSRMWLSWWATEQDLILQIANHGIAIPEEDQARIFLPFEQGRQPRSGTIKGSGIGLSVAKEYALMHGGTLQLVEHPQAEVCFQLQVPLVSKDCTYQMESSYEVDSPYDADSSYVATNADETYLANKVSQDKR